LFMHVCVERTRTTEQLLYSDMKPRKKLNSPHHLTQPPKNRVVPPLPILRIIPPIGAVEEHLPGLFAGSNAATGHDGGFPRERCRRQCTRPLAAALLVHPVAAACRHQSEVRRIAVPSVEHTASAHRADTERHSIRLYLRLRVWLGVCLERERESVCVPVCV